MLVTAVSLASTAVAGASTYEKPGAIAVPGHGLGSGPDPASPYPSVIEVSGLPGTLVEVRATLSEIHRSGVQDLDILLVGPDGRATLLMSDTCEFGRFQGGSLTFDDDFPFLPLDPPGDACPSGTFHPTDYEGQEGRPFPPGPPPGPYPATMSVFSGGQPNGLWRLFIFDDALGDVGSIGGWSIELLPSARCSGSPAQVAAHVGTAGDDIIEGTPGPDVILGLGGKDELRGLGGKDELCGGRGKDLVDGGPGGDDLLGQAGKDKLRGRGGRDTCKGGKRSDDARNCERERSI